MWAVGCIFYELVLRQRAFGEDWNVIHYARSGMQYEVIIGPEHVPDERRRAFISTIIKELLNIDPTRRPKAETLYERVINSGSDTTVKPPPTFVDPALRLRFRSAPTSAPQSPAHEPASSPPLQPPVPSLMGQSVLYAGQSDAGKSDEPLMKDPGPTHNVSPGNMIRPAPLGENNASAALICAQYSESRTRLKSTRFFNNPFRKTQKPARSFASSPYQVSFCREPGTPNSAATRRRNCQSLGFSDVYLENKP